jgi:hypothetical protein
VYVNPEVHPAVHVTPSREHSKVAGSLAVNSNVASFWSTVPLGPLVMVTTGAVRSATVHSTSAGSQLALPSLIARTSSL